MDEQDLEALENVKGQLENGYIDLHDGVADEKEFNIIKLAVEYYERYIAAEDTILNKLKSIKVCGGKGEIYNFEAAYILDLIEEQDKQLEQCKDDILEHEKINFELHDENRKLRSECIDIADSYQISYRDKMRKYFELINKYKEDEKVGILELKIHEVIEELERIFKEE